MTALDTSYHRRYRDAQMQDSEFREEYDRVRRQLTQVNAVIRQLDGLRQQAGLTKADLARAIGKDPAAIRRLFSSQANPELKTIAALAVALGAEIQIVPRGKLQDVHHSAEVA